MAYYDVASNICGALDAGGGRPRGGGGCGGGGVGPAAAARGARQDGREAGAVGGAGVLHVRGGAARQDGVLPGMGV